jgi:hypothetical protein
MKFGKYIMAPEPISTAYFMNPSNQSVCLYVYPPIVARQRLQTRSCGNKYKQYKNGCRPRFLYCPCCVKRKSVGLSFS